MHRQAWSLFALTALAAACGAESPPQGSGPSAPGAAPTASTRSLETGANVMQTTAPVDRIAIYLNGFHPTKDDPSVQMESHHFCDQVNEEFMQCVLYDGNTADARLHGLEFIISERLFETLPEAERAYWHPHNYEILSGTLRLPGLPNAAEHATLRRKINTYGKTWHVWMTGVHGRQADALPMGPAHLAWSFNRDGEAHPEMIRERDRRLALDTEDARRNRQDLVGEARPQEGVDLLRQHFPKATPIPGVVAKPGATQP